MFDVSMSWVSWVAIVVIQAIIHFGIIGPRNRKRQQQQMEEEPIVLMEGDNTTATVLATPATPALVEYTTISNDDKFKTITNSLVESTSVIHSSNQSMQEEDETDTKITKMRQQQHLLSHRHPYGDTILAAKSSLGREDTTSQTKYRHPASSSILLTADSQEEDGTDHPDVSTAIDSQLHPKQSQTQLNHHLHDSMMEKEEPQYGSEEEEEDDNDDDSCYSNEDEAWRYELVQYYYSPGMQSIQKIASDRAISNLEKEDDPAMETTSPTSSLHYYEPPVVDPATEISPRSNSSNNNNNNNKRALQQINRNYNYTLMDQPKIERQQTTNKRVIFADDVPHPHKSSFASVMAPMVCT